MQVEPLIIGEVGSVAHGLGIASSDHDYHGLYLDAPEVLVGLRGEVGSFKERDQPEGVKSQPGDSETTMYGLRHYVDQCARGNPTFLTLLFTPTLTVPDKIGIQAARDMLLSKRIANTHIGYAHSMYRRLTGDLAPRNNRPDLIAAHGYDTKACFHALRLLIQGNELLRTGTMTMPMDPAYRAYLLKVRNGEVEERLVLEDILDFRRMIEDAKVTSKLPDHPDMNLINSWLMNVHRTLWDWRNPCSPSQPQSSPPLSSV